MSRWRRRRRPHSHAREGVVYDDEHRVDGAGDTRAAVALECYISIIFLCSYPVLCLLLFGYCTTAEMNTVVDEGRVQIL
jgi:hypothetical protein